MSGLTWRAMVAASASNPEIAARVKHFSYRVPLEFYDYQEDIDARHNRIDDPELQETIERHRAKLVRWMRDTNDPQFQTFQEATR